MNRPLIPPNVPSYRRLYLRPEDRLQDGTGFRRRLATIVRRQWFADDDAARELGHFMESEFGLEIHHGEASEGRIFYFETHFLKAPVADVLESINAIGRYLGFYTERKDLLARWVGVVRRVFSEEHMRYRIDDDGVVHPLVDQAFELARVSAIEVLQAGQFTAARTHFESALDALEEKPADTRNAVRHCFEAAENVFKLMTGGGADLTKASVESALRPVVNARIAGLDQAAQQHVGRMVSSFASWADSGHPYRHAQGTPQIQAPTFDHAVLYLNTGAGFIRWLAQML